MKCGGFDSHEPRSGHNGLRARKYPFWPVEHIAKGQTPYAVREMGKVLELPTRRSGLEKLRKGDERTLLLAALQRRRTTVGLKWVSEKLVMGHPGSVSRLIGEVPKNRELKKRLEEAGRVGKNVKMRGLTLP